MNPQEQFCPNLVCSARGSVAAGNIVIHSQKEQRYKCKVCGKTFSETTGTALYGIKKGTELFIIVVTLLAYGCPVQAIVMAFGLDERTVRDWLRRSGLHCQQVHEHMMETHAFDLGQVQADEIKVKTQCGTVWMALAVMVSTRFWLGGVVGAKRDKCLLRQLANTIRQWALCRPLLLAVDGWKAYVDAFQKAFRHRVKDHKGPGRARLTPWRDVAVVQVVKQRSRDSFSITRRIVQGTQDLVTHLLQATQNGGLINTAYIERLNATFRQRLAPLVRRSRGLARTPDTLQWGMYLVGCVYNFCTSRVCAFLSTCPPTVFTGSGGHPQWRWASPTIVGLFANCLRFRLPHRLMSRLRSADLSPKPYLRRWQHDHAILWCYHLNHIHFHLLLILYQIRYSK